MQEKSAHVSYSGGLPMVVLQVDPIMVASLQVLYDLNSSRFLNCPHWTMGFLFISLTIRRKVSLAS